MKHEMDDAPITEAAKIFDRHAKELFILWKEFSGGGLKNAEATGQNQAKRHERQ